MILLLDQGNHRLKWQLRPHTEGAAVRAAAVALDGDWRGALATDLAGCPPVSGALVASVAGPARSDELRRFLEAKGLTEVVFAVSREELGGVRNGYRDPARLGIDRWCAAVAAYRRCREAVLVADVGTAWTYDLVDATGRHLGGWIAPGPATQRGALHAATAALPYLAEGGMSTLAVSPAWGQDTEAAIRGGVRATTLGFLAIAEEAAQQCVGPRFARVVTGGDRDALPVLRARGYTMVEDLVLDGLALYAAREHTS